jgi:hypothetical protein
MRTLEAAKMLGGAIVVYVAVAARGSGADPGRPAPGGPGGNKLSAVPTALASPVNGTRLKVRTYVASDGSALPTYDLHDSLLDVECSFSRAADDMTRCLPSVEPVQFFSDPACAQPVAGTPCASRAPRYVFQETRGSSCGPEAMHILPVGGAYSGPVYTKTHRDRRELCAAVTASYASFSYFTVGAEVPPSEFVEATLQTAP